MIVILDKSSLVVGAISSPICLEVCVEQTVEIVRLRGKKVSKDKRIFDCVMKHIGSHIIKPARVDTGKTGYQNEVYFHE